jgi:hypothetical protein
MHRVFSGTAESQLRLARLIAHGKEVSKLQEGHTDFIRSRWVWSSLSRRTEVCPVFYAAFSQFGSIKGVLDAVNVPEYENSNWAARRAKLAKKLEVEPDLLNEVEQYNRRGFNSEQIIEMLRTTAESHGTIISRSAEPIPA